MASVIDQYTQQVKPAFDQYVAPSRKHADVIIPWARYVTHSVLCIGARGLVTVMHPHDSMLHWRSLLREPVCAI